MPRGLAAHVSARRAFAGAALGFRLLAEIPASHQSGAQLQDAGDHEETGCAALVAEAEDPGRRDEQDSDAHIHHEVGSKRNQLHERPAPARAHAREQDRNADDHAQRRGGIHVTEAEDPRSRDHEDRGDRLHHRVHAERKGSARHGLPPCVVYELVRSSLLPENAPGMQIATLTPMLAQLVRELPEGDYVYEPKWDGFRCLAGRDGGAVELRSRHGRPLERYFPELIEALAAVRSARWIIDGE